MFYFLTYLHIENRSAVESQKTAFAGLFFVSLQQLFDNVDTGFLEVIQDVVVRSNCATEDIFKRFFSSQFHTIISEKNPEQCSVVV